MSETETARRFDLRELSHALGRFATGTTVVVTLTPKGKREGLTANSFAGLSSTSPLMVWSLNSEGGGFTRFSPLRRRIVPGRPVLSTTALRRHRLCETQAGDPE